MDIESLVLAAKKGDDQSFYMLINENKDKLFRIAYSYLRNEVDSLEAIQEVTFRAYTKIHKLKEPKYFNTWLIRILINYCIDEVKRKKKTIFKTINEVSDSNSSNREYQLDVEMAIRNLDPKYQTVIILKYFQDLTISEIAQILNSPEGTVKTWLNKSLNELRKYLRKDGELYV